MATLNVHYLPQFVSESDLADRTVVVIDLLRASTTICFALARGAESVIPFLEVDHVRRAADGLDRQRIVMGGERDGRIIDGFDLGNSPEEYRADEVFGRTVLFTTTNGTRALDHARLAQRVVVAAAVNREAAATAVAQDEHLDILCAGTGGVVTREDVLAAGAVTRSLLDKSAREMNSWAEASLREWEELVTTAGALGRSPSEQLAEELKTTPGGKNLLAIGQETDLPLCAQLDVLEVVPERDQATGAIGV